VPGTNRTRDYEREKPWKMDRSPRRAQRLADIDQRLTKRLMDLDMKRSAEPEAAGGTWIFT